MEALAEAARAELARIYGGVVPEHHWTAGEPSMVVAERALAAIRELDGIAAVIEQAIRDGRSNAEIIEAHCVNQAQVREIRKWVMRAAS